MDRELNPSSAAKSVTLGKSYPLSLSFPICNIGFQHWAHLIGLLEE